MSELELIQSTLARTARRRRIQSAWRGFWLGFLAGAVLWLVVLLLYKLFPLPEGTLAGGAVAALLVTMGGLVVGLWRRPGLGATARWVDDQQHFQERLSTALEVAQADAQGAWCALVVADAAGCARRFNPRAAMPFRLPHLAKWCLLVLALAAGLGFVPEYRSDKQRQEQKQAEMIRETGRQLTELVRRELATRPPALETTRRTLEDLQELGQQMGKVKLDRSQSLKELASLTDRIEQQLQELGKEPALRKLSEGERTAPFGAGATPEGLQKQIETLQQELGQQAAQSAALENMQQQLQDLRQMARAMDQADAAGAEALRKDMAQAMAQLAQQAEQMGLDVAGLEEAVQALAASDIDRLLQDLDLALDDLGKMADMARAMSDLQKQLAQLGKDLAEQLEKGQGFLAYATLQRMIRQLEGANLTPEQLESILAEVAKAVPPGLEYGALGEFLQQAVDSMRQGERPEAAQSLNAAAEELKRLMDQLSDCQGLMAALESLKIGQMCVGNNMSWGLCKGGACRPGFKPGGKPGRGVGSWADDGVWMDPENSGLWDNSGIARPDLDPRGFTDRGDGELNDALNPTKVRGQINPGGPMPSITLRGVSIRGQSRVDYEQRVSAAQSEAQSALNQDQVPRAYQGAVRDYFGDLD